jgi:Putative lumazine-binding
MNDRERMIKNYVEGYNHFDIEKMVSRFHETIVFENIQNGEVTLSLVGLTAFIQQAEKAKAYFKYRSQTIKSFRHLGSDTEVEIEYYAILGMDFPNGLKSGHELKLKGKSIFTFNGDSIIKLIDIS